MSNLIRLQYVARAIDPIAHSEGVSGNETLLRTEEIIDDSGQKVRIPLGISGNAIKHTWLREPGVRFMLHTMGVTALPSEEVIHLLFSGGPKMDKSSKFTLADARKIAHLVPILSALGYSAGNHMERGKIEVSDCLLICRENLWRIPRWARERIPLAEYEDGDYYRTERMSTRHNALGDPATSRLLPAPAQAAQEESLRKKASGEAKSAGEAKGDSTQMISTMQCLAAGCWLFGELVCRDLSELELSAVLSALYYASVEGRDGAIVMHVGGKRNAGFGRVLVTWMAPGGTVPASRQWEQTEALTTEGSSGRQRLEAHYKANQEAILSTLGGLFK